MPRRTALVQLDTSHPAVFVPLLRELGLEVSAVLDASLVLVGCAGHPFCYGVHAVSFAEATGGDSGDPAALPDSFSPPWDAAAGYTPPA